MKMITPVSPRITPTAAPSACGIAGTGGLEGGGSGDGGGGEGSGRYGLGGGGGCGEGA